MLVEEQWIDIVILEGYSLEVLIKEDMELVLSLGVFFGAFCPIWEAQPELSLTGRGSAKTSKTRKNKKKRPVANKKSKKVKKVTRHKSKQKTRHGEEYIDLAHTMIKVRARILKPDGSAVLEDSVGPVNNFLHSMFNQVDVYFNQKVVTPPNNLCKVLTSRMSLWATDSYGAMDSPAVAVGDARNKNGLVSRQAFTKGGKAFDLLGHLHCDVFNQDKFLMNGVELRVRLIRAKDDFCLMDDSALNYKLRIVEASLIVRRVKLSPGILIAHAKTLLPKRIILGFVANASFNGSRKKNPFNFQNFGINFLCLNVDGRQVPTKPLQPSFTSGVCLDVEAFNTLFAEIDSTRQVIVDYSG
ncbi:uncharacterized protein F54H12.2-like [Diachasmimorpha longicaudata]|uniref:uncharacterized protein F54H12.2-like n=1 Tax=Diachasmimorpha longicaudata TaxID=58733 RepID=UPI0030B8968C